MVWHAVVAVGMHDFVPACKHMANRKRLEASAVVSSAKQPIAVGM
jgi:hypothetical protein